MVEKVLAQELRTTTLGRIGGEGLGPFGSFTLTWTGEGALTQITKVISAIIGLMTVAAAIWFMFQLLVGGLNWMTSGGDKAKYGEARDRITHAFIGLIIVIAGWAILALVGMFFGYNILINPDDVIQQLNIGGAAGP